MTSIAGQRARADARKALAYLEEGGFKAMLAGGCVRDKLLGDEPKDYDIATTALPDQTCALFAHKGVKAIPTGVEHGTITIVMPSGTIEVTTLRRDVATDGRRAVVAYSDCFKEDAMRRDFTMNAMYEDRAGVIHDFHDGINDLKQKVIRFVGPPDDRIMEDYLRILRLYRFWSRYGFHPEPSALEACERLCGGIKKLSQERITSELLQIFAGPFAVTPLKKMAGSAVWTNCLPIEQKTLDFESVGQIQTTHNQGLARFISILLQSTPKDLNDIGTQMKLDSQSTAAIKLATTYLPTIPKEKTSRAEKMSWLDDLETNRFKWGDFFCPIAIHTPSVDSSAAVDMARFEETYGGLRRTPLPVTGKDLQAMGKPPGPELGEILVALKSRFRNGEWETKEEGLRIARELVNDQI